MAAETTTQSSAPVSEIKSRLSEMTKTAMKAGDKEQLATLRGLHAAIRKREIDDRVDLDDTAISKLIQSLVKQRQDSIEQFTAGGRQDLVDKETKEMNLLMTFLPKQMEASEIRILVEQAISETGAQSAKDMGAVMKVLMPKVAGKADGKLVNQIVREKLN
jgi:uncharacterized protein YqeY